jgi:cytochrome c peroxidase
MADRFGHLVRSFRSIVCCRRMNVRARRALVVVVAMLALTGCGGWADSVFCTGAGCAWTPEEWSRVAALANPPPAPPDPTNSWADDPAAVALGRRFYFDAAFSGPSRMMDSIKRPTTLGRSPAAQPSLVSCATCHDLAAGGVDVSSVPANVSIGAGVTDVNALPTLNAGRLGTVFWNGRLDSLWGLNLVVAESDTTMNGNRFQTAHVLAERYADDVDAVFASVLPAGWRARARALPPGGKPGATAGCQAGSATEPAKDAFDCATASDQALATTLLVVWAKALAAFERQLVSRDSAFDRFVTEGPQSAAISASAQRGARLFVTKGGCVDCHSGPLLSDGKFHDVGAPQTGPSVPTVAACKAGSACDCVAGKNCLPWGAYNGEVWMRDTGPRWFAIIDAWNDDPRAVPHVAPREPFDEALKGAWRTPSLRDVALTAPYMHDGAYAKLADVLAHYNDGGRSVRADAVGTPAIQIAPLLLDADELADLEAFLASLTGAPLPDALVRPPADNGPADGGLDGNGADAGAADAGSDAAGDAEVGDAGDARPAVPKPIQDIFNGASCAGCHGAGGALPPILTDAASSFATLVGAPVSAVGCTDRVRVVPGNASGSYLVAKLRNASPPCGQRMPYGRPPLPEAQIQAIEAWIVSLPSH